MLIKNAAVLDESFRLSKKEILIRDGKIAAVGVGLPQDGEEVFDAAGLTAVPGFVDVHIHGCDGEDASDGTVEAIRTMGRFLLRHGVTSFCPTTMTADIADIEAALANMRSYKTNGARLAGAHLEGPFLSSKAAGAHPLDKLQNPDKNNTA